MRSISITRLRLLSLFAGAGVVALASSQEIGCSSGDSYGVAPSSAPGSADAIGTVGLKLTLPGGETLNTANWTITGPNGASAVVQSGMTNVANSNTLSTTIGGIPAGSGYSISITGTTVDGTVSCAGSATFGVTARATTNVTVLLQCGVAAPDAGAAAINGLTYACGTANGTSANPSETTLGNSVSLTATGSGPTRRPSRTRGPRRAARFGAKRGVDELHVHLAGHRYSDGDGLGRRHPRRRSLHPGHLDLERHRAVRLPRRRRVTRRDDVRQRTGPDAGAGTCALGAGGAIQHVIYLQFDNTHLSQDVPSVASDLMQMPHLLSFIRGNGTMLANDHTILIAHTAGGILSTLTGVYPDRHGQDVSNSYARTSTAGKFSFPSSFQYWSNTVASGVYNLTQADGTNMPAPWVPYTKAGCNFGGSQWPTWSSRTSRATSRTSSARARRRRPKRPTTRRRPPRFRRHRRPLRPGLVGVRLGPGRRPSRIAELQRLHGPLGTQSIDPILTGGDAAPR